jgi:hypothetical protein
MGVTEATVRRLALSLPATAEAPHFDMTAFRVNGKIFATIPPEGGRVHIFVSDEEVDASCAEYPGVVEELWWGTKRRGCRVLLKGASAPLLRELLVEAWRRRAPKKVLATFDGFHEGRS